MVPVFQCWRLAGGSPDRLPCTDAEGEASVTRCCVLSPPEPLQKGWWAGTSCEPDTWVVGHQFSHLLFGISVHPFSSPKVARYTCLLFFKNIVNEVSDISGQGLLATASKLHDIKFWLMLCSGCGCQLWVIMSAFGKHLLCLCTWRMISGTCSSTAAPLPCHVLSHEEPGFTRMELLSCLKSWVNIHPYPGFRYSKRHSFGWTQNWTSGESPRDFKVHWLI